jgi:hypothetical protein
MSRRSFLVQVPLVAAAARALAETPATRKRIVGVKIYEHAGDRQGLFDDFESLGFDTLFISEALASDDEFRAQARRRRMAVFVIEPVFYDPEALKKDPDLFAVTGAGRRAQDDWVAFVCPTRDEFRQRKAEAIVASVARLGPEGVSLDFIRYFAYWESVGPERSYASIPSTCYCPRCLERFALDTGVRLPPSMTTPQQAAAWIEAGPVDVWATWKCRVIASMVEDLVRRVKAALPGIHVNLHAVPWRRSDFGGAIRKVVGQDFAALSRTTDYLSPMCYSAMLKRDPAWVHSVVEDLAATASCPILPSIQVGEYYPGDRQLGEADFEACLDAALLPPSAGVVFWSWALIEKTPASRRVIASRTASRASRNRS